MATVSTQGQKCPLRLTILYLLLLYQLCRNTKSSQLVSFPTLGITRHFMEQWHLDTYKHNLKLSGHLKSLKTSTIHYRSTEVVNAWLKNHNKFPKHSNIVSFNLTLIKHLWHVLIVRHIKDVQNKLYQYPPLHNRGVSTVQQKKKKMKDHVRVLQFLSFTYSFLDYLVCMCIAENSCMPVEFMQFPFVI